MDFGKNAAAIAAFTNVPPTMVGENATTTKAAVSANQTWRLAIAMHPRNKQGITCMSSRNTTNGDETIMCRTL